MRVFYYVAPYSEEFSSPLFETSGDYVPPVNSAVYYHPNPNELTRYKYITEGVWFDVRPFPHGTEMIASVLLRKTGDA